MAVVDGLAGFSARYARILKALKLEPDMRASEILSRNIGATNREIYVMLGRMEHVGLVQSQISREGERRYALTDKGARAYDAWEFLRALGPARVSTWHPPAAATPKRGRRPGSGR